VPRGASSGTKPSVGQQSRALLDRDRVAAGQGPHADVLDRGVVDGEPEAHDAARLGPQVRVVGVALHLAADPRSLEDVHRLQQARIAHADRLRHAREILGAAEGVEGRVEVVQRVPQLVQARVRRVDERAIRPHGVLLVEGARRRAAVEEPALVGVARRPVRAEDHRPRALGDQPLGQSRCVLPQPLALARVDEAFEHEESSAPERRDFLRRQGGALGRAALGSMSSIKALCTHVQVLLARAPVPRCGG